MKKKIFLLILCLNLISSILTGFNASIDLAEEEKTRYLKITRHIGFVEIVKNVSFFIVKGLVQNNGTKNMISVNVTATFYNEKGQIIAETSGRAALKIIKAGQESPFEIYLPLHSSPAPTRYNLLAVGLETDEEPYGLLKIKNVKDWVDDKGFHKVSGEVYNMGPMIAKSVRVICAYYNYEGKLLAISDSVVDPVSIKPGGKSRFEVSSYPFTFRAMRYDLFVAAHHYERVASANWMLFSILITATVIFLVYMKRRGW